MQVHSFRCMNTIYVMFMLIKCYMLSLYLIINEFLFICLCLYVSMGISTWLVQGALYLIGTERIVDESICNVIQVIFVGISTEKRKQFALGNATVGPTHFALGNNTVGPTNAALGNNLLGPTRAALRNNIVGPTHFALRNNKLMGRMSKYF